jgi:hypothetical protein
MTLDKLVEATADDLIERINRSSALGVFSWLKVEIIDILISKGYNAIPEHGLIDVTFENVAIELKTVNTNYRDNIAENMILPITNNVDAVIHDINNLHNNPIENKFVIFVVFPSNDSHQWGSHLQRINDELDEVCCAKPFNFNSGVSGTIYYGRVT